MLRAELTATQMSVLKTAAARQNGSVYPILLQHLKGAAAKKVTKALEVKGLIDETGRITTIGLDVATPEWNKKPESFEEKTHSEAPKKGYANEETEQKMRDLAEQMIPAIDKWEWPALCAAMSAAYDLGAKEAIAPKEPKEPKHSKRSTVLDLLRRPEGASLGQIVDATGWQAHTARAFLSNCRKEGLPVTKVPTRTVGPGQTGSPGSYTTYFLAE